jgi:glutathione S-transferase
MKLWISPASPFARKPRIVAREAGLAARIEEIETAVSPVKANEALAPDNPLMKIPALRTDDGVVLYDSPVICEYLDSLHGEPKLFPAGGPARWSALRIQALGDGILDAGILRRYELLVRPEDLRWQAWLDGQKEKMERALDVANADAATFGPVFDIGQITIACAVGWLDFRFPDWNWRNGRPALTAWLERISARPSMQQTMPKG